MNQVWKFKNLKYLVYSGNHFVCAISIDVMFRSWAAVSIFATIITMTSDSTTRRVAISSIYNSPAWQIILLCFEFEISNFCIFTSSFMSFQLLFHSTVLDQLQFGWSKNSVITCLLEYSEMKLIPCCWMGCINKKIVEFGWFGIHHLFYCLVIDFNVVNVFTFGKVLSNFN